MLPIAPLPLHHSWPIAEAGQRFEQRFDLGVVHDGAGRVAPGIGAGRWTCDLRDGSLRWSDAVYDIFGLPRGALVSRDETVALYVEESRAAMERLRGHAIKHRRGFTLDVAIMPTGGARRWMRLVAAAVCEDRRVVRLEGVKQDVTSLYR